MGGVHILGGRVFSASSKRQQSISLSSTEAEIMSASLVGAEVMYHQGLPSEMGYDMTDEPTTLWVGNSGVAELARRRE